jgi:hypothetical protein
MAGAHPDLFGFTRTEAAMKFRTLIAVAVAVFAASVSSAATQDSVAGTWNLSVVFEQGSGSPTIVLQQDGEKLTGTYTGQMGQYPLSGTFTEKKITFTVTVDMQGNQLAFVYTGTLEADGTLKGTVDLGGMASGTWTGKKAGAPAP